MRPCLLSAFVFLGGCHGSGGGCPMNFERLNDSDHAAINIDSRPIAEIKSPDRLRSLVGFAKSHGSGWSVPWYGTPVARLTVWVILLSGLRPCLPKGVVTSNFAVLARPTERK
jgi:hypothetical protein